MWKSRVYARTICTYRQQSFKKKILHTGTAIDRSIRDYWGDLSKKGPASTSVDGKYLSTGKSTLQKCCVRKRNKKKKEKRKKQERKEREKERGGRERKREKKNLSERTLTIVKLARLARFELIAARNDTFFYLWALLPPCGPSRGLKSRKRTFIERYLAPVERRKNTDDKEREREITGGDKGAKKRGPKWKKSERNLKPSSRLFQLFFQSTKGNGDDLPHFLLLFLFFQISRLGIFIKFMSSPKTTRFN